MSKSYVPGDDVDAIIARQVEKGNFPRRPPLSGPG
jgi:hypothetical protein